MDKRTVVIRDWKSPATDYPARKMGRAEIVKRRNTRGDYYMEGVRGYLYAHYPKGIPITVLKIRGKVWMTDDPQYVWSLQSFAERAKGKVLVAGLGLGIVAHQLCQNPAVTQIDVIDRDMDVIRLVTPLIPQDGRLHIHHDDFYEWCQRASDDSDYNPDTVIWDLAVGTPDGMTEGKEIVVVPAIVATRFGSHRWDLKTRTWVERKDWHPIENVFVHGVDRDPVGEEFAKTEEFRRVHRLRKGKGELLSALL